MEMHTKLTYLVQHLPTIHFRFTICYCICTAAVWYTVLWNVLNFPSGVVPVTKVTNGDLQVDKTSYPAKDIFHKTMKQVSYSAECFVITILVLGDLL